MDKLPEIFGFKAEVPLADGIGGEGVELFDPRADDEFRERAMMSCALAALPTLGCGTGACSFSRMSRFST